MVYFRKSKKLGPLRLTASKSGLSMSGGVRGARVSANTKGEMRRTLSVPGAGIYDTKRIGGKSKGRPSKQSSGQADSQVYRATFEPVDATGGERLRGRERGVESLKVVGVKGHAELAIYAGIAPREDGWIGGIRDALLIEEGLEYRVLMLITHADNPALYSKREDKSQPKGIDVGRLGKRDADRWAPRFGGRTIGVSLFIACNQSGVGQAEARLMPELLDVAETDPVEAEADPSAATHDQTVGAVPAEAESAPIQVRPPEAALPPAAWYPDPNGEAAFRYWDGAVWTAHISNGE